MHVTQLHLQHHLLVLPPLQELPSVFNHSTAFGTSYHTDRRSREMDERVAQLVESLARVVPSAAHLMTAAEEGGDQDGGDGAHSIVEDVPLEVHLLQQEEELAAGGPLRPIRVVACSYDEAQALCAAACALFPVSQRRSGLHAMPLLHALAWDRCLAGLDGIKGCFGRQATPPSLVGALLLAGQHKQYRGWVPPGSSAVCPGVTPACQGSCLGSTWPLHHDPICWGWACQQGAELWCQNPKAACLASPVFQGVGRKR
jgi:hypothetical protein